jgi:acetyl/propionyl-CoA carboxylase alpha subunit
MSYRLRMNDQEMQVEIIGRRPQLAVRIDGIVHDVAADAGSWAFVSDSESLNAIAPATRACDLQCVVGAFELTVDGTTYAGWRCVVGDDVFVRVGGRTFVLSRVADASAAATGASSQLETRADMPGVVIAVHCEAGQAVSRGDKLVTIESMKLQATLTASHEAIVERVHVSAESAFERGALLVSFAGAQTSPS